MRFVDRVVHVCLSLWPGSVFRTEMNNKAAKNCYPNASPIHYVYSKGLNSRLLEPQLQNSGEKSIILKHRFKTFNAVVQDDRYLLTTSDVEC